MIFYDDSEHDKKSLSTNVHTNVMIPNSMRNRINNLNSGLRNNNNYMSERSLNSDEHNNNIHVIRDNDYQRENLIENIHNDDTISMAPTVITNLTEKLTGNDITKEKYINSLNIVDKTYIVLSDKKNLSISEVKLEDRKSLRRHFKRLEDDDYYSDEEKDNFSEIINSSYTKNQNRTKKKIVCLNINGHKDSEKIFQIFANEMLTNNSDRKYNLCGFYVFDNLKDDEFNYSNKKISIVDFYSTKFLQIPYKNIFIIEEKRNLNEMLDNEKTEFNQLLGFSKENGVHFIATSFNSLKGPFVSTQELNNNLHTILLTLKTPIIIFKEFNSRLHKDEKKNEIVKKGYNWFILLDNSFINCFKAFTTFAEFIDKDYDNVYGVGVYNSYITFDIYKKQFSDFCQGKGYKNYKYESFEYVKKIDLFVFDKINYQDERYDFLVMYNNVERYYVGKENSDSWKIIKKAQTNVCLINNLFVS